MIPLNIVTMSWAGAAGLTIQALPMILVNARVANIIIRYYALFTTFFMTLHCTEIATEITIMSLFQIFSDLSSLIANIGRPRRESGV